MAYRQLRAVAFVLLGVVSGCGSGNGGSITEAPDPDASPPYNEEQPSWNFDQPPASSEDHTPITPDAPPDNASESPGGDPGSPPGGGGGNVEALCQEFCSRLLACPAVDGVPDVCEANCRIQSQIAGCESEAAQLFTCALGLGSLCGEDGDIVDVDDTVCDAADEAVEDCIDGQNPEPPPVGGGDCTPAQGCACGGSACLACTCAGIPQAQCADLCAATQ